MLAEQPRRPGPGALRPGRRFARLTITGLTIAGLRIARLRIGELGNAILTGPCRVAAVQVMISQGGSPQLSSV
jgi:hypothetical protein